MSELSQSPEWGVLLKVHVIGDSPDPTDGQLASLMGAMPGPDKRLTGGGSDFTVWAWFEAEDASASIKKAAAILRAAADREGLKGLHVIRAHAASVEGRSSPFRGVATRLGRADEWTVYFRVAAPRGGRPATAETLDRIEAALAGPDTSVSFGGDREKFLLDDGRGIVIRFWVAGPNTVDVFRAARHEVVDALATAGLSDWTIVRMQAATAEARHGDTFPGVAARRPEQTEETR